MLERERKRIARTVHDELGQALTAIKMDLSLIADSRAPEVSDRVDSALSLVDDAMATVRRITSELRPGQLDDLGLADTLAWEARQFQRRAGIRCILHGGAREPALDEDTRVALFRCFQESLTNVARHAAATRVDIYLKHRDGEVELEIMDNGVGIAPGERERGGAFGLIGMRERMAAVGGTLGIVSRDGGGTTVWLRVNSAARGRTT